MLSIQNLKAKIDNKEILKGLNLKINAGEVHAIMGPNGSGKSTLSNILSGKKGYEIEGVVDFNNENLKIEIKDYYFSNVVAKSSKTMIECNNAKMNLKSTGTEG